MPVLFFSSALLCIMKEQRTLISKWNNVPAIICLSLSFFQKWMRAWHELISFFSSKVHDNHNDNVNIDDGNDGDDDDDDKDNSNDDDDDKSTSFV